MSRAARLLDLLELLRAHRRPLTADSMAAQTGMSVRTIYRDLATLAAQGAPIEGEAGVGFVLQPGFTVPPLMFRAEEAEALVLGLRWVALNGGDPGLSDAAQGALAKIEAVLPDPLRRTARDTALIAGPSSASPPGLLPTLRDAIRKGSKLRIDYRDEAGRASHRTVWPLALSFFDQVRVLVAWCETRDDFRHFRADRIDAADMLAHRIPGSRAALLARWRARENVPDLLS